jgi:hypothetical protein
MAVWFSQLTTPVHLDYTTLYGAALALEPDVSLHSGVRLSRLLSLSQFIEALVLYDRLQFEDGATPDWQRYNDALQRTMLLRSAKDFGLPLTATSMPVDTDDVHILDAFDWARTQLRSCQVGFMDFAIRHRSGSYDTFPLKDRGNPTMRRYFEVVRESHEATLNDACQHAQSVLPDVGSPEAALHIFMRLWLLQRYCDSTQEATYLPHYSRQPLITSGFGERIYQVHRWTMDQLRSKRELIFQTTEPGLQRCFLERFLSPILVACLYGARRPADIIDNALEFRYSDAAKSYRGEFFGLIQRFAKDGERAIQMFKDRLHRRIEDLNDLLHEKGVRKECRSQWAVDSCLGLGWMSAFVKTSIVRNCPGDATVTLLSDILSQSLGILQAEECIQEVFGGPIVYDCPLVTDLIL